jgi:starch phosphorylase
LNLDSLFDVQVKRIHEYKRQTVFAFYILSEYLKLKNNPNAPHVPRTFLVGGKAAPGYAMAKLVIKFINSIAEVVNQDREVGDKLKVLFLENYRVSLAEKIFPASDLSEQISTAGMEASGTGCMKFMVNGALTVGTLDGANIEIAEEVGPENIFTFGLTVEDVQALSQKGYRPGSIIQSSPVLLEIIKLIQHNFFSPSEPGIFYPLIEELMHTDRYFVCADFGPFCETQEKIAANYRNPKSWTEKAVLNVARSGKFSSDRTIAEYARDIWHVPIQSEQVLSQH